ncbi:MAG: 3'-5' exonuclease domain-containing protein 2 [Puniceicoccales bacterium]|jgi:ribonuclease D|nr:3'-5' exonuclease domain-containing protein 2 [Puniceicoccales bacterium]
MPAQILSFIEKFFRTLKILPKYPKKISKEKLQKLPVKFYDGAIHFINTEEAAREAIAEITGESVLGFDTESKPAFFKGEKYLPSILQIATATGVYIFQLTKIGQLKFLKPIFEREDFLKVGIAIRDDVLKLRDIENFKPAGFRDISDLSKSLGIEQTGMRNLAGIFLKCRISKTSQVTDWSQENLTTKQLIYAATDAWISRELYLEIKKYIP